MRGRVASKKCATLFWNLSTSGILLSSCFLRFLEIFFAPWVVKVRDVSVDYSLLADFRTSVARRPWTGARNGGALLFPLPVLFALLSTLC
jgi:hypothetical protein